MQKKLQTLHKQLRWFCVCCGIAASVSAVQAQTTEKGNCESCANALRSTAERRAELMVYPNPATDYIALTNDDLVAHLQLVNLVGKRVRTFEVQKNENYDVSDLPNGLYLVQLIGKNNKVLATQRLTIR